MVNVINYRTKGRNRFVIRGWTGSGEVGAAQEMELQFWSGGSWVIIVENSGTIAVAVPISKTAKIHLRYHA